MIVKSQEITESEFVTEKLTNTGHSTSVPAAGKVHTFQLFFFVQPILNGFILDEKICACDNQKL